MRSSRGGIFGKLGGGHAKRLLLTTALSLGLVASPFATTALAADASAGATSDATAGALLRCVATAADGRVAQSEVIYL